MATLSSTNEFVQMIRAKSGIGLMDVRHAVEKLGQDELLVLGYLKYNGCAVRILNGKYDEWVMEMAQKWKEEQLEGQADVATAPVSKTDERKP